MLHVVLFQPQIPQNTGNIGRLCAFTKSRLHLIHPLGFALTDTHLKRSGMDYWEYLDVHHHADWEAFRQSDLGPKRLWLFTTHAQEAFWDVAYEDEDGLLFGNEGAGCPEWLHEAVGPDSRVTIPNQEPRLRSLNLATSVGIGVYGALKVLS
tara:strand:- start:20513 stop:20968 length:456 start_codon:yes stop_codon:yes gene_type:complete